MYEEWNEHRWICEKASIECFCGANIKSFHKLQDGKMPDVPEGEVKEFTAFDLHLRIECEKTTSHCKNCGNEDFYRRDIEKHVCTASWSKMQESRTPNKREINFDLRFERL